MLRNTLADKNHDSIDMLLEDDELTRPNFSTFQGLGSNGRLSTGTKPKKRKNKEFEEAKETLHNEKRRQVSDNGPKHAITSANIDSSEQSQAGATAILHQGSLLRGIPEQKNHSFLLDQATFKLQSYTTERVTIAFHPQQNSVAASSSLPVAIEIPNVMGFDSDSKVYFNPRHKKTLELAKSFLTEFVKDSNDIKNLEDALYQKALEVTKLTDEGRKKGKAIINNHILERIHSLEEKFKPLHNAIHLLMLQRKALGKSLEITNLHPLIDNLHTSSKNFSLDLRSLLFADDSGLMQQFNKQLNVLIIKINAWIDTIAQIRQFESEKMQQAIKLLNEQLCQITKNPLKSLKQQVMPVNSSQSIHKSRTEGEEEEKMSASHSKSPKATPNCIGFVTAKATFDLEKTILQFILISSPQLNPNIVNIINSIKNRTPELKKVIVLDDSSSEFSDLVAALAKDKKINPNKLKNYDSGRDCVEKSISSLAFKFMMKLKEKAHESVQHNFKILGMNCYKFYPYRFHENNLISAEWVTKANEIDRNDFNTYFQIQGPENRSYYFPVLNACIHCQHNKPAIGMVSYVGESLAHPKMTSPLRGHQIDAWRQIDGVPQTPNTPNPLADFSTPVSPNLTGSSVIPGADLPLLWPASTSLGFCATQRLRHQSFGHTLSPLPKVSPLDVYSRASSMQSTASVSGELQQLAQMRIYHEQAVQVNAMLGNTAPILPALSSFLYTERRTNSPTRGLGMFDPVLPLPDSDETMTETVVDAMPLGLTIKVSAQ